MRTRKPGSDRIRPHTTALAAALVMALAASCTSTRPTAGGSAPGSPAAGAQGPGPHATGRPTPGIAGPVVLPSAPAGTVDVAEPGGAGQVTVRSGQQVAVFLFSSYWGPVSNSAPGTLVAEPTPASLPLPDVAGLCGSTRVPGGGCGLFVHVFRAGRDGTAVLSGLRTSCGEAMACAPGQGSYRLTVIIEG
ncbi:MAG TPA: hypothetical protein VGX23_30285 [Actinocrinis sp.]|nr:hypothetical protein [Actinocrinis sp.]